MGLGDLKKKREQPKPTGLAALRAKRQSDNGAVKKSTGLAAIKAKREQGKPVKKAPGGLAALKKKRQQAMKLNAKQDFIRDGIKYHNCQFVPTNMEPACYQPNTGAFWSVDVTNGDKTMTFHNRWGSWFSGGNDHDELRSPLPGFDPDAKGAKSPATFAMQNAIQDRYVAELKARKLPRPYELIRLREEQEKQERQNKKGKKNKETK